MASAIPLQSSTLEGQLIEVLTAVQQLENNLDANPNNLHNITGRWIVTNEEFSFQGEFMVRTSGTVNEQGQLVLTANEYLTAPSTGA